MAGEETPAFDAVQIRKFGDAIGSSAIRKSFQLDPLSALEKAGVDVSKVPIEAIDVLADLSPEELDLVGRLSKSPALEKLKAAGDTNGYVVF